MRRRRRESLAWKALLYLVVAVLLGGLTKNLWLTVALTVGFMAGDSSVAFLLRGPVAAPRTPTGSLPDPTSGPPPAASAPTIAPTPATAPDLCDSTPPDPRATPVPGRAGRPGCGRRP